MDIPILKKQRGVNKGKLTNILKFVQQANAYTSVEECRTRLQRVENLMEEFTAIENKIFALDVKEDTDAVYEENYYTAVTGLNTLIRSRTIGSSSQLDTSLNATLGAQSEVKLPKLQIPHFSGDYAEWQSFYDLFCTTIHESQSLNPVQKFQYLKGLLRGEAALLVRHISITEGNYIGALNKLKERYDRKKHIINTFIKTFMEQQQIHIANVSNIKRLMDTSDEIIRGLKALGENAEARDPWLIFILMNKLDEKSKSQWAETAIDLEHPNLADFFSFLSKRIDTLESLASTSKRTFSKPSLKGHVATTRPSLKETQINCAMCQNDGHSLFQCKEFNQLNIDQRRNWIKSKERCYNCLSVKHPVFKCNSKYRCHICKRKHHTLLHGPETSPSEEVKCSSVPEVINMHCSPSSTQYSILPTAEVNILDATGKFLKCRALLDSGAQASFITETCVQRLQLKRHHARIAIRGVGHSTAGITKGIVNLEIASVYSKATLKLEALVLPTISSMLPPVEISQSTMNHWQGIQFADPHFNKPGNIDILIGADYFFYLLESGQIKLNPTQPILQKTIFGWVVAGKAGRQHKDEIQAMSTFTSNCFELGDIDNTLKRFWELETINQPKTIFTSEEELCEQHFSQNTKTTHQGRFIVSLPFKRTPSQLGQSLNMAIARLRNMERRFTHDSEFARLYKEFMSDYEKLKHMEEIPSDEINDDGYYLPHHGVLRKASSTTKLRVVFDGSAKTTSGTSLNECLAVGPATQSTLFSIILRFRENRISFSADIEKMYRQVNLAENDKRFQKIVWRENPSNPIRHYRLNTVTYGLASAPFLATRALNEIANRNQASYPAAARAIRQDMYVDDLMTGAETYSEAEQLRDNITDLLRKHGFELRKWQSNSPQLLQPISEEQRTELPKSLQDVNQELTQSVKVLGVIWKPTSDEFTFTSEPQRTEKLSKRIILSEASRLFDPLGWLAPITVTVKIFMQLLWASSLDWDDPLTQTQTIKWQELRKQLENVNKISIPRYLGTRQNSSIQLHGFCDASQSAYAAVVYFRIQNANDEPIIKLISAKTKVAPIKPPSLPRLELCGAVLLVHLIELIRKNTNLNFTETFTWTDSKIVLDWLSSHPRRWSTFVCNRTAEILTSISRKHWYHVSSKDNPADCASRGLLPDELLAHSLWWNGPNWLRESTESWPLQNSNYGNIEEEANKLFVAIASPNDDWYHNFLSNYSSFRKSQRVLAFILRFYHNLRKSKGQRVDGSYLHRNELFEAQRKLCQFEQDKFYAQEIALLRSKSQIHRSSALLSLNPFLDNHHILRVGGRLENSMAHFSTKHPIILHPKSRLTMLILQDAHFDNKHAGPTLLLHISRKEYWIPMGKFKAKEVVKNCVTCSKFKAQLQGQLMGNLPKERVQFIRPFLQVGIDYAGPISIHLTRGRGQKTYKSYICLFICFSTKAVHLELVGDMTSEAFLGALKRFTARRGIPKEFFSDNGSNFIGANNRLREVFSKLIKNSNYISDYASRYHISWHFNPPYSPHFGGIWEAAIKSTKYHLIRVIGKQILTMEEMNTLLAEIEGVLNSRPICRTNSTEIDALTPSHFLIGHADTKFPEEDITNSNVSPIHRWKMVQQISQHFWKRWHTEYLTSLQHRSKWKERKNQVTLNDIVVIKDSNLPVSQWSLGRVIKLHPGVDEIVRVVTLQTRSGEITRPIHRLCILPIQESVSEETDETLISN